MLGPNITGSLNAGSLSGAQNIIQIRGNGAFSYELKKSYFERVANGSNATGSSEVRMKASNLSAVFGDSTTVQPNAFQTLIIIKI